jgi:hypothetical protein
MGRNAARAHRHRTTHRGGAHAIAAAATAVIVAALAASCGPAIEYRPRPGFATSEELPDEIVLPNGKVIRYLPLSEYLAMKEEGKEGGRFGGRRKAAAAARKADDAAPAETFTPWRDLEDGRVEIDALFPEHVVANTMRAFREERFGDLWDQFVASGVRARAAQDGGPEAAREQFTAWCGKRRGDVMTLLNRMSFGFSTNAVVVRRTGPNFLELSLSPQTAGDFRYRVVEVAFEQTPAGQRARLAGIR